MYDSYQLPKIISTKNRYPSGHLLRLVRQYSKQIIYECRFSTMQIVYIRLIDMTHITLLNPNNQPLPQQLCLQSTTYLKPQSIKAQQAHSHLSIHHIPSAQHLETLQQILLNIAIIKLQMFPEQAIYEDPVSDFFYGFDGVLYYNCCVYLKRWEIRCLEFLGRELRSQGCCRSMVRERMDREKDKQKQRQKAYDFGENMRLFQTSILNTQIRKIKNSLQDLLYHGIILDPLSIDHIAFIPRDKQPIIPTSTSNSNQSIDSNKSIANIPPTNTNDYQAIVRIIPNNTHPQNNIHSINRYNVPYFTNKNSSDQSINQLKDNLVNTIANTYRQIESFLSEIVHKLEEFNSDMISQRQSKQQKFIMDFSPPSKSHHHLPHPHPHCHNIPKSGAKITTILKILKTARLYAYGMICKLNSQNSIENVLTNFFNTPPTSNITLTLTPLQLQLTKHQNKKWVIQKFQQLQKQNKGEYNQILLKNKLERSPYEELLVLKKHFIEGIKGNKTTVKKYKNQKEEARDIKNKLMGLGWGELVLTEYRDDPQYAYKIIEHLKVYEKYIQVPKLRLRYHFYKSKLYEKQNKPRSAIFQMEEILKLEKKNQIDLSGKQKAVIYHELGRLYAEIYVRDYEDVDMDVKRNGNRDKDEQNERDIDEYKIYSPNQQTFNKSLSYYKQSLTIKHRINGLYSIKNLATLYNIIGLLYQHPQPNATTLHNYIYELTQVKLSSNTQQKYQRWLKAECRQHPNILNFLIMLENKEEFMFYNPILMEKMKVDKKVLKDKIMKDLYLMLGRAKNPISCWKQVRQLKQLRKKQSNKIQNSISISKSKASQAALLQSQQQISINGYLQQITHKSQYLLVLKLYISHLQRNSTQEQQQIEELLKKINLSFSNRVRVGFLEAQKKLQKGRVQESVREFKGLIEAIQGYLGEMERRGESGEGVAGFRIKGFYVRDHVYKIYKELWRYKLANPTCTSTQYPQIDWQWILHQYHKPKLSNPQTSTSTNTNQSTLEYLALCLKYISNYQYIEIMLLKLYQKDTLQQFRNIIEMAKKRKQNQKLKSQPHSQQQQQQQQYWHSKNFTLEYSNPRKSTKTLDLLIKAKLAEPNPQTFHRFNTCAMVVYMLAVCAIENGNFGDAVRYVLVLLDGYQGGVIGSREEGKEEGIVFQHQLLRVIGNNVETVLYVDLLDMLISCRYKQSNLQQFLTIYTNNSKLLTDPKNPKKIQIGKMLIKLCYRYHRVTLSPPSSPPSPSSPPLPLSSSIQSTITIDNSLIKQSILYWLSNCQQICGVIRIKGYAVLGATAIRENMDEIMEIIDKIQTQDKYQCYQVILTQLLVDPPQQLPENSQKNIIKILQQILALLGCQSKNSKYKKYSRLLGTNVEVIGRYMFGKCGQSVVRDRIGVIESLIGVCIREKGSKCRDVVQLIQRVLFEIQRQYKEYKYKQNQEQYISIALSIYLLQTYISKQTNKSTQTNTLSPQTLSPPPLKQILFQNPPLPLPKSLATLNNLLNNKFSQLLDTINSLKQQYNQLTLQLQKQGEKLLEMQIEERERIETELMERYGDKIGVMMYKYYEVTHEEVYEKIAMEEFGRLQEFVENGFC